MGQQSAVPDQTVQVFNKSVENVFDYKTRKHWVDFFKNQNIIVDLEVEKERERILKKIKKHVKKAQSNLAYFLYEVLWEFERQEKSHYLGSNHEFSSTNDRSWGYLLIIFEEVFQI